jgi:hypothetical protein
MKNNRLWELARRNPRQTTNKRCLLQDLPELANVSNNIILYLHKLFPMMLTNPFSSAKLLEVSAYAKLFSQNISHPFSRQTIRVTAMTGAAAMEIGGVTTASEFHYMQNKLCYAR